MVLFLTASFNPIDRATFNKSEYDFSGTNSLFIESGKGLKFHWITNGKAVGAYELIASDNSIIQKGNTAAGYKHSVTIDHEIVENVVFRFGSQHDAKHEVSLRPKSVLTTSILKNVDSLFVVGDVHGRYEQLINLLKKARIINEQLDWTAGRSNLVFLGDLFDRGDDVTKTLWFIYQLEEKAVKAGGRLHLVLGNHEIMTMSKDLRYLGKKESAIARAYELDYDYLFHPNKSFLGSWLSAKPSVLKIDTALFAHGGIIDLGTDSIHEFNQTVISSMQDPIFLKLMEDSSDSLSYDAQKWTDMRKLFYSENSPFWYRGYVNSDSLGSQLRSMLRKYDSKIHIVAHTPLKTITKKYKGRLYTTDLKEAATQLLLLVRKKRKYTSFKIDDSGTISKID
jgi:hypothetical protein